METCVRAVRRRQAVQTVRQARPGTAVSVILARIRWTVAFCRLARSDSLQDRQWFADLRRRKGEEKDTRLGDSPFEMTNGARPVRDSRPVAGRVAARASAATSLHVRSDGPAVSEVGGGQGRARV
jgi:hypothetical protein